ncbi:hypothetical protein SADUNF_Sadunf02G0202700 [Salix dunnii]|uniref:Uncharacterized protein n=1 Tax=Salix dunnii TaxID=1413687 RepID=A0A835N8Y7_9ROSI|nr:hypothetical protein SADUNF_Sadunf02G0202700 [Salix dunnii]
MERREGRGGIGGDQEMDYSLAALKVPCVQLKDATLTLGIILFQRAWLQGILVSSSMTKLVSSSFDFLATSTALFFLGVFLKFTGIYVMVVGRYFVCPCEKAFAQVQAPPREEEAKL